MALNTQRPPEDLPVDETQVGVDIENLYRSSKKNEEVCRTCVMNFLRFHVCLQSPFFEVLINRSNPHIAAVWAFLSLLLPTSSISIFLNSITGFAARYKSLSKVIKQTLLVYYFFVILFFDPDLSFLALEIYQLPWYTSYKEWNTNEMVKVSGVMLNYWKNPWRNLIIPNSVTGLFFVSYHLFDIHPFLLTDSPIFYRLICAHWDPIRFEAIKAAYEQR